jgi:dienelactone hydrolase
MPCTRKPSVRQSSVLLLAALLVGAAGCQARPSRAPASATTITPTPASPISAPQPADQCGTPSTRAQTFWLDGPGGDRLQAATVGSGRDAAVFVHQSGTQGLCDFWPYAAWLADTKHVRAVLVDQCGYGASTCPGVGRNVDGGRWVAATRAAVAWTRAHGARRITLVGASFGGIVVLHAARSIQPPVNAVVDLSGELRWAGVDSLAAGRHLRVPALLAVAPGDRYVSVGDMRRLYAAIPARPKRLVVAPAGAGHGWALLTAATGWSPLGATTAAWIHGRQQ